MPTIPFFPRFIIPPWVRLTKKAADDIQALLWAQMLFYIEFLLAFLYEFFYDRDLRNISYIIEYSFIGNVLLDILIKIAIGLIVLSLMFYVNYLVIRFILKLL